jgi:hypothetical protein
MTALLRQTVVVTQDQIDLGFPRFVPDFYYRRHTGSVTATNLYLEVAVWQESPGAPTA